MISKIETDTSTRQEQIHQQDKKEIFQQDKKQVSTTQGTSTSTTHQKKQKQDINDSIFNFLSLLLEFDCTHALVSNVQD